MRGPQVRGLDAATGFDPQVIAQNAHAMRTQARAASDIAASIAAGWHGLSAVYRAPEAMDLERAMAPIDVATRNLSSSVASVSAALETYAQDLAGLQLRQRSLTTDVNALMREAAVAEGWQTDSRLVGRQASLQRASDKLAAGVGEAETRCVAAIEAARNAMSATSTLTTGRLTPDEFRDLLLKAWPFHAPTATSEIRKLLTSAGRRSNIGPRGTTVNVDFLLVMDGLSSGTYSIDEVLDALALMSAADRSAFSYYLDKLAPSGMEMDFVNRVLIGARSRAEVEDLASSIPALEPAPNKEVHSWETYTATSIQIMGPSDINQGQAYDCWLLAGLGAAVVNEDNRKRLQENIKPNSNGTYTVTLYPNGTETSVTVSGRVPVDEKGVVIYARSDGGEPNWVSIYEKAAAIVGGGGGYQGLSAGHPASGIEITTGMETKTYGPLANPFGHIYLSKSDIEDLLAEGKPITALVMLNGTDKSTAALHVYYVTGVADDGRIRVRNPWGHAGGSVKEELLLTEQEFNRTFSLASSGA